jgi:hypothetical protein
VNLSGSNHERLLLQAELAKVVIEVFPHEVAPLFGSERAEAGVGAAFEGAGACCGRGATPASIL